MKNSLFSLSRLLLACCLFLAACGEEPSLPGDVASVDGQGISFQDMESARAQLFSGPGAGGALEDDAALHAQYRYVLGSLIEELVICRHMEQRGMTLDPGALEAEEARIRADYPEGSFEEMLVNESLSLDRWRRGLYRRLLVEKFLLQVLRPEISITPEEAQNYFLEHSEEFVIPEQWHFLQIAGRDKKLVESTAQRLLEGEDAAGVQKDLPVTIHDISMGVTLLPEDLVRALTPLQPVQASKAEADGKEFRAFVLLEKIPSSMLDAAEISRRVDQALSEEKMRSIYAAWIQQRLSKADIRITPLLSAAYPASGGTEGAGGVSAAPPANATQAPPARGAGPFANGTQGAPGEP